MLEGETQEPARAGTIPVIRVRKWTRTPRKPSASTICLPARPVRRGGRPGPPPRAARPGARRWLSGGCSPAPDRPGESAQPARRPVQAGGQGAPARLDARGRPSADPIGRPDGQDPAPVQGARMPQAGRLRRRGRPVVQARPAVLPGGQERGAGALVALLTSTGPSWSRTSSTPDGRRPATAWRGSAIADKPGKDRESSTGPRRAGGQDGRPAGQRPDGDGREGGRLSRPARAGLVRVLGEAAIPVGMFQVEQGQGARGRAFCFGLAADGPQRDPNPRDPDGQARSTAGLDQPTWSRPTSTPRPTAASARSRSWPGRTARSTTASSAAARRARPSSASAGPLDEGQDDRRLRRRRQTCP